MKVKILAVVLAVMLMFTATSCSVVKDLLAKEPDLPAPDTVLTAFAEAIKECDFEAAGELTSDPDSLTDEIDAMYEELEGDLGGADIDLEEFINSLFEILFSKSEIKEIKDTTIEGDKAVVTAVISAPDMNEIIKEVSDDFNNMTPDEMLELLDGVDYTDESAVLEAVFEAMFGAMEEMLEDDCEMNDNEIEVEFVKGETSWLIDAAGNDNLISALAGIVE